MKLEGSCHCGSITFQLESPHPYPFNLCYCSVCRKTAGSGGYAINLSGKYETLKVNGEEHKKIYHVMENGVKSPAERHFCVNCASALWVYDRRWPGMVHPFASVIDTELPLPPERTHLMLDSKASWVPVKFQDGDKMFPVYPDESIAQWHERHGLLK